MDTLLDNFIIELEKQRDITAPILEGFKDYVRVGLTPSAKVKAEEGVAVYQDRLTYILDAIVALNALRDNFYPTLPRFSLPQSIQEDFQTQEDTISAALAQLDVEAEVTHGSISIQK